MNNLGVTTLPKKLIVILLAIVALPASGMKPACAQQATWLTEENVKAYAEESAASYRLPYDEHLAFIKKATHDDFSGTIDMNVKMPSQPPTQTPITLNKESMINSSREGYDSVQGAKIDYNVKSIKISADKKSATVESEMRITNQKLSSGESMQSTISDSVTLCTDEVVYTPMVGVQILISDCKSDITVKQEQEL